MSYLDEKELVELKPKKVNNIKLIQTDNYNEQKVFSKIKNSKNLTQLFACALHIAIVGVGNKKYGTVVIENKEYDIRKIFDENNVLMNLSINSTLKDDDLTPRRLVRFFRYHIKEYIIENNRPSYLWRKYCGDLRYSKDIFPGSEHMCDKEIGFILYETYKNLDERLITRFCERLERIFIARGIFNIKEISDLKSGEYNKE